MIRTNLAWTAFLVVASVAAAQDTGKKAADEFLKRHDKDGNGYVDRGELEDKALFAKADRNKDGRITAADFLAGVPAEPPRAAPRFEGIASLPRFDENRNGQLDPDEIRVLLLSLADYDYDGVLTEKEAREMRAWPFGEQPSGWFAREFRDQDKNADELLALDEIRVPAILLRGVDQNGDGAITFDEAAVAQVAALGGHVPRYAELSALVGARQKIDRANWLGDAALFRRMDDDRSGDVSVQEFDRYVRELKAALSLATDFVTRFDLDGDGKVSRPEFQGSDSLFARLDHNKDGFVSRADRR